LEKIASIDIGSNTLRLLIAEKTAEGIHPVFRDREMVRLGRHFYPGRSLSPPAMNAALKVLKRFKKRSDQEGAARILAVGTGVLREAVNRWIFLDKIEEETQISVRIISGVEEARIMARGVLSVFPSKKRRKVIFDMGGGSTEFVFLENDRMGSLVSLPLGVVALTEKYLCSDPPKDKETDFLRVHGRNILKKYLPKNDKIYSLIGTAGTVTTLAAMAKQLTVYDPDQINGTILTRDRLRALSEEITTLSFTRRSELEGLEPGRADIIVAGVLLVLEITDHFSQKELLVSDAGLLEGIILS
jgi:exopolyphosphatase / guanosine-5'-triphosphate,3'-diphosphate pyrophosphatase